WGQTPFGGQTPGPGWPFHKSLPVGKRFCAEPGDKLAQAFPRPCELRRNFPLVAAERSTGSVRSFWEHVFLSPANRRKETCRNLALPPMETRRRGWFTPRA